MPPVVPSLRSQNFNDTAGLELGHVPPPSACMDTPLIGCEEKRQRMQRSDWFERKRS